MIGNIKPHPETIDSYYTSFISKFPDPTRRRLAALSLLPGKSPVEGFAEYPTRTILAAQWADSRPAHRATAELLYSLSPTLLHMTGQTILRMTGITYQDILLSRKGTELPRYGWSIDIGHIQKSNSLEYGFRPTPTRSRPSDLRPGSNLLDFQVSIPVKSVGSLDTFTGQTPEISTPIKETADFPAYSGTVSLEQSGELYSRVRDVRTSELIFGNGRSFGVVYAVMKASDGELFEAFKDQMSSGNISPQEPLPDLSTLL